MFLRNLELINFRNVQKENILFDKNVNIIFGKNGQGKTSLLEAIYLMSITKSFRTNSDKIVINHSADFYDIKGQFVNKNEDELAVRLYYSLNDGKNIFLNKNRLEKFSELIGLIPVILLSLEDLELTYGVPANRRRFIDILLSQISPVYLQSLQFYKKILASRNRLLSDIYENKQTVKALFPWDEQLIKYGVEITIARRKFINYLDEKVGIYYRHISDKNEKIAVRYKSNICKEVKECDGSKLKEQYFELLEKNRDNDIQRQNTLSGPHRDDVEFLKDGYVIKAFGSQGENKTLLIALKFVESEYLKSKTNESPLLLMDDIFGELDNERISRLMEYVSNIGQTFITTTLKEKFKKSALDSVNYMHINSGSIVQ